MQFTFRGTGGAKWCVSQLVHKVDLCGFAGLSVWVTRFRCTNKWKLTHEKGAKVGPGGMLGVWAVDKACAEEVGRMRAGWTGC